MDASHARPRPPADDKIDAEVCQADAIRPLRPQSLRQDAIRHQRRRSPSDAKLRRRARRRRSAREVIGTERTEQGACCMDRRWLSGALPTLFCSAGCVFHSLSFSPASSSISACASLSRDQRGDVASWATSVGVGQGIGARSNERSSAPNLTAQCMPSLPPSCCPLPSAASAELSVPGCGVRWLCPVRKSWFSGRRCLLPVRTDAQVTLPSVLTPVRCWMDLHRSDGLILSPL